MGARQDLLAHILQIDGSRTASRPSYEDFVRRGVDDGVLRVYRALGGQHDFPRIAPGKWDLVANDYVIELDEERHFNRYRAATLESPLYDRLIDIDVPTYAAHCRLHESDCLRAAGWGGNWTSPSTEREFGPSSPPRDLSTPGPARWKQRAFYDFIKDLAPLVGGPKLIRIAIWDDLASHAERVTVGDVLEGRMGNADEAALIVEEINRRRQAP